MAPGGTRRGRGLDSAARLQALTRRAYTATAGHLDLDDDAGREFDRIVAGEEPGRRDAAPRGQRTGAPRDGQDGAARGGHDGALRGARDAVPRLHRAAPARRWAVSGRAVLVVLVVVGALAGVVVARAIALGSSDAVPLPHAASRPPEAGYGPSPGPATDGHDGGSAGGDADGGPPVGAGGAGTADEGGGGAGAGGAGAPADPAAGGAPARVVVHVAGAVHEPGVVELAGGARVAEAIDAAGGARPGAELAAVNLARPVQDGEQVYVPAVGEAEPGAEAGPAGGGSNGSASGGAAGGAGGPGGDASAVVDLNTADLATLDTLPGVGPAIAERILQWRDAHGPFHTVEELLEVSGIGPATLERLRDRVRV